jgi:hypothetical protein
LKRRMFSHTYTKQDLAVPQEQMRSSQKRVVMFAMMSILIPEMLDLA